MSSSTFTTTTPLSDSPLSGKREYSEEGTPNSNVEMDPETMQAILMSVPKETKTGLRHSASCQKILAHLDVEIEISLTTTEQLSMSCPHEGCQDVLKDVKSLKMHLAIHEIAKEVENLPYGPCLRCGLRFDWETIASTLHDCEKGLQL